MNTQLTADRMTAFCRLDRIDVADDVGDGDVGCRELLDVTLFLFPIADGRAIAHFLNQVAASAANWRERAVIDLATFDDGNDIIQEFDQVAQDPALRLAAQAKKNHVVA